MAEQQNIQTGLLLIFAAHSGAGKSTIISELMRRHPDWLFSVSCTTRRPRDGEVEGKAYYFITEADFRERIADGRLLEHEEVFGDLYGTPVEPIHEALEQGLVMILDLDVLGAVHVQKDFSGKSLSIFIDVPDLKTLEDRLRGRKTDSEEAIARRLGRIPSEREMIERFDRVIVNDKLQKAVDDIEQIIREHR